MIFRNALFWILMLCLIGGPYAAYGQEAFDPVTEIPDDFEIYQTGVTANDIELITSPEIPGAFQNVSMVIDSNFVDLRRYSIKWFVDNRLVAQGVGKTTHQVLTKGYGQTTTVDIVLELPTLVVRKKVVLIPQDMTIMWEAVDSYVPPFYPGKKLPARESIVKMIAIPNVLMNGKSIDPKTLVYNWKRNGTVITEASGYGKESILIKNNKLRTQETFEVIAGTPDYAFEANQTITLNFIEPGILFYEKDEATGITNPFAKRSLYIGKPSATVVAVPFYFSLKNNRLSELMSSWTMNNRPLVIPANPEPFTLRLENPGGTGAARLGISITNPLTDFQSAQKVLDIVFNTPQ